MPNVGTYWDIVAFYEKASKDGTQWDANSCVNRPNNRPKMGRNGTQTIIACWDVNEAMLGRVFESFTQEINAMLGRNGILLGRDSFDEPACSITVPSDSNLSFRD